MAGARPVPDSSFVALPGRRCASPGPMADSTAASNGGTKVNGRGSSRARPKPRRGVLLQPNVHNPGSSLR